jgi:hypothetical protein
MISRNHQLKINGVEQCTLGVLLTLHERLTSKWVAQFYRAICLADTFSTRRQLDLTVTRFG